MLRSWYTDWNNTPKNGKIALYISSAIMFLLCLDGAIDNLTRHSYADVAAEPLVLIFLLLIMAVWPFRLASAVRKRGGNFTAWVWLAILFSGPLIGVAYLAHWRSKPVIVEDAV